MSDSMKAGIVLAVVAAGVLYLWSPWTKHGGQDAEIEGKLATAKSDGFIEAVDCGTGREVDVTAGRRFAANIGYAIDNQLMILVWHHCEQTRDGVFDRLVIREVGNVAPLATYTPAVGLTRVK